MKKIKIRFVKIGDVLSEYKIQKKSLFGWNYISYSQMGCTGDYVSYDYTGRTKEELLEIVLDQHFKRAKRFVEVEQHPTIRIY
jgi:hypothetical protein